MTARLKLCGIITAFVWTAFVPTLAAAEQPATVYQVGVAKIDITPDYPIRLNGFGGRRAESEGVRQRIWAKALAIAAKDEKPAILFTVDNLGLRMPMVDEVALFLKNKAGVPRSRVALTFTHSHTTPKVNGSSDNIFSTSIPLDHQKHIDRYTQEIAAKLKQVALDAIANMKPATLHRVVGKVGFARNRRTPGGPVDHDLPMLVVKSPAGKICAVYVSYACHCVTLSDNKISGDWAGYAQEMIERKVPGVVALVSIGCGSDSNPDSSVTGGRGDVAQSQGAQIADEVARLIKGKLQPVRGKLKCQLHRIDLPLRKLPTREALQAIAKQGGANGYNAQTQITRLDRGEKLLTKIDYPIQTWTFDDNLAMVFLAGEVCADYSLRLKRELWQDRIWLHGYSNDFCGYIPSERLLKEGGYGGGAEIPYFAWPTTLAPGMEQLIIDQVRRQLPKAFHAKRGTQGIQPKSPQDSRSSIQVAPRFRVELVVSEPLIVDPVAIDFGPDGRLWVAEMNDYPAGLTGKYGPGGRIRVVTDSDGDGKYDRSTIFLEGIPFPTGVTVWRKGILVCAAPDILYAEDTDGDGKADIKKVLFSGFATHNYQARVNSLCYGLDGWVYGAAGLFGGKITTPGGKTVDVTNRDFRIRPDSGEIEPLAGQTQQGRARDDWENWFGCQNGALAIHFPLVDHYLSRNPHVVSPSPNVSVPSGTTASQLFPIGETVRFEKSGPPGRPTSGCGLGVYRDTLLGDEMRDNLFTCEPVNQLVHREVLSQRGGTFSGKRAGDETDREFLASDDRWFRPVQARTGPDGALYVVDMYRYVIEHPIWIDKPTLAQLDVRAGSSMGRIYRIVPRNAPPRKPLRLDRLTDEQLAAALDSPNGPQRDLIQQMLLWHGADVGKTLSRLATEAKHPAGRLHALCTLDGLKQLTAPVVKQALADAHPGVRRHAIRLAEQFAKSSPELLPALIALVDDADPQVRRQLGYSLGAHVDVRASKALARLAIRDQDDVYLLTAVLSSIDRQNLPEVLASTLSLSKAKQPPSKVIDPLFGMVARLGDKQTLAKTISTVTDSGPVNVPDSGKAETITAWHMQALTRILSGLRSQRRDPQATLDQETLQRVDRVVTIARRRISNTDSRDEERLAAVRLLGVASGFRSPDREALLSLLAPQVSLALQSSAVAALARQGTPETAHSFLARWNTYSPSLRNTVLDALLQRSQWAKQLLRRVGNGDIPSSLVDASRRQRLLTHQNIAVRQLAAKVFDVDPSSGRGPVVAKYLKQTPPAGNRQAGRNVFNKHCAICHRLEEQGHIVGPDLAALTGKTRRSLLTAILDPNRDIDQRYLAYTALRDGETIAGVLSGETATSITLKGAEGKQQTLLRSDLEALRTAGMSLMPEGVEKEIGPADMAHLLAYLLETGPTRKKIAGNSPRLIEADRDGIITLSATTAAIYGGGITFEKPFGNIGMWHGQQDHLVWQVRVKKQQRFDVYLDWACAADSAGNLLALEGAEATLLLKVPSTGAWSVYHQKKIGQISFSAGEHRMIVRPAAPLRGALIDLRRVILVPQGRRVKFSKTGELRRIDFKSEAKRIVIALLDEKTSGAERNRLIADSAGIAGDVVARLTGDLKPGSPEEYRRIPFIWRVSIAAGRRNDGDELKRLIAVCLASEDSPLHDWQAVALGGGVINGLTQAGVWPKKSIDDLVDGDEKIRAAWNHNIAQASKMADNKSVPSGTRYDALRMLGIGPWNQYGTQLVRYLGKQAGDELQMGAVSALGDIPDSQAAEAILAHFNDYSKQNADLAIDAMLRSDDRIEHLLAAIAAGRITTEDLGKVRIKQLTTHPNRSVRDRSTKLLLQENQ